MDLCELGRQLMATATLRCTNAATGSVVVNNVAISYGGGFVEATQAWLSCTVNTTVRVNGAVRATDTSSSVVDFEEATGGGLPIWLLYIATQPQSP